VIRARLFLFAASMVVAALVLPLGAELFGMQLAGTLWVKANLTLPLLAQAGHVFAGLIGGALVGLLQWALVPRARARWAFAAALGGLFIGLARAVWLPLAIVAAPAAAGHALAQGAVARGRMDCARRRAAVSAVGARRARCLCGRSRGLGC